MSEYQYYEFLAIDRPLTAKEMSELRSISSRAEITVTRFSNTYNWGDLKGSSEKMMEKYFDAHVYVTNWGSFVFMLRLPRGVIPEKALDEYVSEDTLTYWTTREHLILSWSLNDEEGGEWIDGEGWMAQLVPIRDELERGDYRALYIGWLAGIGAEFAYEDKGDEYDEDNADERIEPPVPRGLGSLTAAQKALAEFINLDKDLLVATAKASPAPAEDKHEDRRMTEWVAQVPEKEARKFLLMVLQGESRTAERLIRSRYQEFVQLHTSGREASAARRRTVSELRALTVEAEKERRRQEALEKKREKAECERKRRVHLSEVARDFPKWWKKADDYAAEQKSSAYDQAQSVIVDLRDAYAQEGKRGEFAERIKDFTSKHVRKQALMRRLKESGIKVS